MYRSPRKDISWPCEEGAMLFSLAKTLRLRFVLHITTHLVGVWLFARHSDIRTFRASTGIEGGQQKDKSQIKDTR